MLILQRPHGKPFNSSGAHEEFVDLLGSHEEILEAAYMLPAPSRWFFIGQTLVSRLCKRESTMLLTLTKHQFTKAVASAIAKASDPETIPRQTPANEHIGIVAVDNTAEIRTIRAIDALIDNHDLANQHDL